MADFVVIAVGGVAAADEGRDIQGIGDFAASASAARLGRHMDRQPARELMRDSRKNTTQHELFDRHPKKLSHGK